MSAIQTIFEWINAGSFPPPPDRKGNIIYGPDDDCWLCGGPTNGQGWPLKKSVKLATFTNHDLAKSPQSKSICQPCAMSMSSDGWQKYLIPKLEAGFKEWNRFFVAARDHACGGLSKRPKLAIVESD